MFRRIVSAPQRSTSGIGSTMLPFDLLIDAPPKITWPWFISRSIGSVKPTIPMSNSTFVRKRQYKRCRIACSTPPMYWSTGIHRSTATGSNGCVSACGEQ